MKLHRECRRKSLSFNYYLPITTTTTTTYLKQKEKKKES